MNLLDENIPLDQRDVLAAWGVKCRVIGQDIAELSVGDDNILKLLHHIKQPTLFTRDQHFFKRPLCHPHYCLVWLNLAPEEAALYVRRFLSHPRFDSHSRRLGVVARVHHDGVHFWQRNRDALHKVGWLEK